MSVFSTTNGIDRAKPACVRVDAKFHEYAVYMLASKQEIRERKNVGT